MFSVQKKQCRSCIYRTDSPLDINKLEKEIADGWGGFKSHRVCHHTNQNPACCAGFWARHKDKFQLGQIAQRLDAVQFVETEELDGSFLN